MLQKRKNCHWKSIPSRRCKGHTISALDKDNLCCLIHLPASISSRSRKVIGNLVVGGGVAVENLIPFATFIHPYKVAKHPWVPVVRVSLPGEGMLLCLSHL